MRQAKQRRLLSWLPFGWVRNIFRQGGKPYLNRYSLFHQKASGTNERRIYLHHFLAPDDAGHHNHPFAWSFSIVLKGSYYEDILDVQTGRYRTRTVRWFNFIRHDKYHRIAGFADCDSVWTLFIAGPLNRKANGDPKGWGFWVPGRGHIPHKQYIEEQAAWHKRRRALVYKMENV